MIFEYPGEPHVRRHGPRGYRDSRSYKPWLRDEFGFRCVYCLWREVWCADGDGSFSVDHVLSRIRHPERINDFENLVYACCRCNSLKQDSNVPLDPCREAWQEHLEVEIDGSIHPLTAEGVELIAICRLDRPAMTEARRRMIELLTALHSSDRPEARELYDLYRGYPQNLPALEKLRPPQGNTQPSGIETSYSERRRRGTLPKLF